VVLEEVEDAPRESQSMLPGRAVTKPTWPPRDGNSSLTAEGHLAFRRQRLFGKEGSSRALMRSVGTRLLSRCGLELERVQ